MLERVIFDDETIEPSIEGYYSLSIRSNDLLELNHKDFSTNHNFFSEFFFYLNFFGEKYCEWSKASFNSAISDLPWGWKMSPLAIKLLLIEFSCLLKVVVACWCEKCDIFTLPDTQRDRKEHFLVWIWFSEDNFRRKTEQLLLKLKHRYCK